LRPTPAKPETWWDGEAFDGILLDAPCTASGIGRRHPDVRWLRRESDVPQLAAIQARLHAGPLATGQTRGPLALLHLLYFQGQRAKAKFKRLFNTTLMP
jgi:hypothetical protein